MSVLEALVDIQAKLKSPKDQSAGRYMYRNIEDINKAVKPLAAAHGCAVVYTDRFEGGACVSTCRLTDGSESIEAQGFSIVNTEPRGCSIEQSCGSSSSYARKYAAQGLFALDSSEDDPDRTEPKKDCLESAKAEARSWLRRYAELTGSDPRELGEGVLKRPDYEDTAEFWERVAMEFKNEVSI